MRAKRATVALWSALKKARVITTIPLCSKMRLFELFSNTVLEKVLSENNLDNDASFDISFMIPFYNKREF